MSSSNQMYRGEFHSASEHRRWYAVHTRYQHEHRVAQRIGLYGMSIFLPMLVQTRRWSDRLKKVEVPLFSCYVFVNTEMKDEQRRHILYADGVLGVLGAGGEAIPIPDEQIEAIHTVLNGNVSFQAHDFLKVGQRVRILGGALAGVEGIFQARSGEDTLIISVDALQRSISIRISGYEVKAL